MSLFLKIPFLHPLDWITLNLKNGTILTTQQQQNMDHILYIRSKIHVKMLDFVTEKSKKVKATKQNKCVCLYCAKFDGTVELKVTFVLYKQSTEGILRNRRSQLTLRSV